MGLVEFRGFEMPPHAQMSLLQMLLLARIGRTVWQTPYRGSLKRWGTELHDRFMLPHFVAQDMRDVVLDLQRAGYAFEFEWFAPFLEFRFPRFGTVVYHGIEIELRPGHRAVACAGRRSRCRRHCALCGFVGRTYASQGAPHERQPPCSHLQWSSFAVGR
ncbi:MAG: transglutaminase family protein [Nitrosomonadales bacterium]